MSVSFIPASLKDNLKLLEIDPDYESKMDNLSEVERARLRDGNWKIDSAGKREWPSKYWEEILVESFPPTAYFCVGALDPASGKKTAQHDYPAFVIAAVCQKTHTTYVDALMEKLNFAELRQRIIFWLQSGGRPNPQRITIEVDRKQYGESPTDFGNFDGARIFNKELRAANLGTRCRLHIPVGNKSLRIKHVLDEPLRKREIKIVKSVGSMILLEQLQQFGDKKVHDDGPDALAMALSFMSE